MSRLDGTFGCTDFSTYKAAAEFEPLKNKEIFPMDVETPQTFINRANFFEKVVPILEKVPSWRFTPSKWVYFGINKDW